MNRRSTNSVCVLYSTYNSDIFRKNRLLVMADSGIINTVIGKSMKKKSPLSGALSVYEILRLCVILAVQAEYSQARLPMSWYMSVPLLLVPLFLLYTVYKNNGYASFAAELYGIIKIAAAAGFIFFIYRNIIQAHTDFSPAQTNVITAAIYVMPFFAIDVILSVLLIIKNYKAHEQTEGELCK